MILLRKERYKESLEGEEVVRRILIKSSPSSRFNLASKLITDGEHFKLLIFDECHHFPANTYSRLAFLDAQYRIGLSGSPYREDGRSELIYILSGVPYGSDWDRLFEE